MPNEPTKKTTFLVAEEEVATLDIAKPLWRILKRDGRRKGLAIIRRTVSEEDVTPDEPKTGEPATELPGEGVQLGQLGLGDAQ